MAGTYLFYSAFTSVGMAYEHNPNSIRTNRSFSISLQYGGSHDLYTIIIVIITKWYCRRKIAADRTCDTQYKREHESAHTHDWTKRASRASVPQETAAEQAVGIQISRCTGWPPSKRDVYCSCTAVRWSVAMYYARVLRDTS